jgi:hypothetical protein
VQFATKINLRIWNQHKNTDHLIPILTYFKRKKICCPYLANSENFGYQVFSQETAKNTGKRN